MIRTLLASLRRLAPRAICTSFALLLAAFAGGAAAGPASGYWWNPDEPGRGFTIEIQDNTLMISGFLYDASGRATWVASMGPMTNATIYSGSLVTYTGGQTLTGAYQAPVLTPSPGAVSITFTSDTTANLFWPGGPMAIRRYDVVPGGAGTAQPTTNPQTGYWWNASEPGRGFAVEVQNNAMFLAGYMYDATGNPVWYSSMGNMTSPTLFQGNWVQYGNGQTLTGGFRSAGIVNGNAGSIVLQFASSSAASLTLPDGRQIPLTRFAFAIPVISASGSFPIDTALANLVTNGFRSQIALSGTFQGQVATGTGTFLSGAAVTTSFEGLAAVGVRTNIVGSMTAGGVTQSVYAGNVGFFDKNFRPLGQVDDDGTYYVQNTFSGWPAAAKVGDAGQLGTATLYADSRKMTLTGHQTLSYSVEADTADTAVFVLVTAISDANNALTYNETDRYRVTRSGGVTLLSSRVVLSGTAALLFSVLPATPQ